MIEKAWLWVRIGSKNEIIRQRIRRDTRYQTFDDIPI